LIRKKKSQEKLRKNKQNLQQQEDENNPPELGNLKVNENKGFFSHYFPSMKQLFFLGTVYGASKKNQNKTKDQMEEEKILGDLTQK